MGAKELDVVITVIAVILVIMLWIIPCGIRESKSL